HRWRELDSNSWSHFEKSRPSEDAPQRFRVVRPGRAPPLLGRPKVRTCSHSGESFWAYASDHQFVGDAAYINLEIDALHWRAREMPKPNRPTWLPGGRTRRPRADGFRR